MTTVVEYVEWKSLQTRGAVDPGADEQVEGSLLVGKRAALKFVANQSSYGEDSVSILPAFHNGVRCWVRQDTWDAARGYTAAGTNEYILSFEEGVKLLIEHGVFAFPKP